ncbi:MAG: DUF4038 domain-containing protein, partial [Candidatus Sumerlaeota bacterium]|nr:DUF4038 domain-containing protein [Candidatus Sumerlaeota bacterium]
LIHPCGMNWPYDAFLGEKWLSAFGYQSGHGDDAKTLRWIYSGLPSHKWSQGPARPVLNLEPPYEDHTAYQSKKRHTAYNVRRAVYWSLLCAPPAGVTYGAHGIWSWPETPQTPIEHAGTGVAKPWREAMNFPGSTQMGYMVELFTSVEWWRLRPDEKLIAQPPQGSEDAARYMSAARSEKGDLAMIYLPVGGAVTINAQSLAQGLKAEWFDPRSGKRTPAASAQANEYKAPDEMDWVLVFHP